MTEELAQQRDYSHQTAAYLHVYAFPLLHKRQYPLRFRSSQARKYLLPSVVLPEVELLRVNELLHQSALWR